MVSELFTHQDMIAVLSDRQAFAKQCGHPINSAGFRKAIKEVRDEAHRRYYKQLVGPYVLQAVEQQFGMSRLLACQDDSFREIPLAEWDKLADIFIGAFSFHRKVRELGDSDTLSVRVSTLKEAAQQLVERLRATQVTPAQR